MSAPTSLEEYQQRFVLNEKVTGIGYDQVTVHNPCPFCAAADFMVYRVIDVCEALAAGAVCKECGRGMVGVTTRSAAGVTTEFVQTVGDDPPAWLPPMRRVSP